MPGIGTVTPTHTVGSWADVAACVDAPVSLVHAPASIFFAEIGRDPVSRLEVAQAKGLCLECQVQPECLEYALATHEDHGIYGGLIPKERRALLKRRRSLAS
jgi:WhiB family transcriptional regulator, redox-sensing transcriptional regulator